MDTDVRDGNEQANAPHGPFYTIFIEEAEYHLEQPTVTGRQVMDLGGIPYEAGLILILEDDTQRSVGLDETIELKPGRRFKRAPRFKRG